MAKKNLRKPGLLLIIAPGHHIFDERVLRTVRVYSGRVVLLCEVEQDKKEVVEQLYDVSCVQFPTARFAGLLGRLEKLYKLRKYLKQHSFDAVYVHEAGLLGLNIINICSNRLKKVFDYHDWIEFDYAAVLKSRLMYKVSMPLLKLYVRSVVKKLDAMVFISEAAKARFSSAYCKPKLGFVVPNARTDLVCRTSATDDVLQFETVNLVWVGNVMRLRQLERLIKISKNLTGLLGENLVSISVYGKIKDEQYRLELEATAADQNVRIKFYGPYNGEDQIVLDRKQLNVGVAFAWVDSFDTGINFIGRPTKVASYGIMGIPALLDKACVSFCQELELNGALIDFETDFCAARKIYDLWSNESLVRAKASSLRTFCKRLQKEAEDGAACVYSSVMHNNVVRKR